MVQASCNWVNGASVSATPPQFHLFLHYVMSLRGSDHSVTYMFNYIYNTVMM